MGQPKGTEPLLSGGQSSRPPLLLGIKYGSLAVMLIGYTLDQVLMKRANNAAYYPAALTVLTAALGVIVYPFIVFGAVAAGAVKLSEVTIQLRAMWKPAAVGFCFTLHHLLLNVAGGKKSVPGIWILVLGKSIVPMSMLLNMLPMTMALKYNMVHWLGVLILLGGVVLTLIHDLYSTVGDFSESIFNIILIVLAQLPLAASFTFIEVSLKGTMKELFTVALWMYICIFQVAFSMMAAPLSALLAGSHSHKGPTQGDHQASDVGGGIRCYVTGYTPEDAVAGTDCATACISWWMTMFFAFAMNVAMPVSARYAGATLMWFVRALSIPLCGLLFASSFLMGDHAKDLSIMQILGLAVVTGGVLLFNSRDPQKKVSVADDVSG